MSGLEHFDREILALDERIGRLALACGTDLRDNKVVVALIKGDFSSCHRPETPKLPELRALLMLKYGIQEHCIASLGAGECLRIVEETHEKLRRRGIGTPGI